MLIGHLGLAQFGKALRRDVPFLWLAVAAYLPDLFRLPLAIGMGQTKRDVFSHSLPSILLQAIVIGAAWKWRRGSSAGAVALIAVCALHWPADVLTGCKPSWGQSEWLGAYWYRHPLTDLAAELALFVAGWVVVKRADGVRSIPNPRLAFAVAAAVQLAFLASLYWDSEFFIRNRQWNWHPGTGGLLPHEVRADLLHCEAPRGR